MSTGHVDSTRSAALSSAIQALDQLMGFVQGGSFMEELDPITRAASALHSALAQLSRQQAAELASAVANRAAQLAALNPPVPTAAEIGGAAAGLAAPFWQTLAGSVAACELMRWLSRGTDEECPVGLLLAPQAAFRLASCCAVALGPGIQATAAAARLLEERRRQLQGSSSIRSPASEATVQKTLMLALTMHTSVASSALALAVADSESQLSRALRAGLCRPQRLDTFLMATLHVLEVVGGAQGLFVPDVWKHLDTILQALKSPNWGEPQLEALNPGMFYELVSLAAHVHTSLYKTLPQLASRQLSVRPWVGQWRSVARVASMTWVQEQYGSSSHTVLRQLLPIAVAALRAVARRSGGQEVACAAVACLAWLASMRLRALWHSGHAPPAAELVDSLEAAAVCAGGFLALLPSAPSELADELSGLFETLQNDVHPMRIVSCLREAPGAAEALTPATEAITRLAAALLQQWQAAAGGHALLLMAAKALGAATSLIVINCELQGQAPRGTALQQAANHAARSATKLVLSVAQLSAAQLEALVGASPRLALLSGVLASALTAVARFPLAGGRELGAAADVREDGTVDVSEATGVLWAGVVAGRALAALPLVPGAQRFATQRAILLSGLVPWALEQQRCFTDIAQTACDMVADAANAALEAIPPNDEGVGKMHIFLVDFQGDLPEHPRVGAALVQCGFCACLVGWVQQAACGPQEGASQEELDVLSAARNLVLFAGASLCSWALERQEHRAAAEEWLRRKRRLGSTLKKKLRPRRVWQQSMLGEVLPQMQEWAEAAAECWRAEEAGMSDADWLDQECTLAWQPCANLQCTTVRGASEARLRGRQCGGCRTLSYCCRSCQEQDWPRHRRACQLKSQVRLPE